METILIVPIGGLLVAVGVLVVIGIIWLFNAATENVDAVIQFANQNTDVVVLVIGGICLLCALLAVIAIYGEINECERNRKDRSIILIILQRFVRALLMALPFTLGLSTVYAWCIQIIDAIIDTAAESVLMWISIPLIAIFGLFGAFVGVLPMIGLGCVEGEQLDGMDSWKEPMFYLSMLAEVLGIGVYIFLMYTCTDLPEYLYNSFGAW